MNLAMRSDSPASSLLVPLSWRGAAAVLAILVHGVFFVLLVLSVNWKSQDSGPVSVELWSPSALTASAAAQQSTVAPPVPVMPPPLPAHAQTPPAPAQDETVTPDIALEEQKQLLAQQAKKQAAEKLAQQRKREAVQAKAQEEARLVEQRAQAAATAQRTKALQKLLAQQMRSDLHAESEHALRGVGLQVAAGRQASQQARMLAEYQSRIKARIRSRILLPEGLQGNPEAVFDVTVLPTGEVVRIRLMHSSGQPAYDDAVQRAILKASPLPMPPDPVLAGQFRELNLHFSPDEN